MASLLICLCLKIILYFLFNVDSTDDREGSMATRPHLRSDTVDNDTLWPGPAARSSFVRLTVPQPLVDEGVFVLMVAVIFLQMLTE